MAPTPDEFSDPGSVSYNSDTMSVGDGTWDFTKNTFLLPNLVAPNFETTKYNGMGNRFSTVSQYHMLILAHGILAVIVFLFLIPAAVMTVRFYHGRPGWAVKYHARMQIVAGILLIVVFVLGFMAVGPQRSLTNPHHGIGIALFVLFWVQFFGGAIIHRILKPRSLRVTLHQWIGRATALLGIAQIPLGLALYGSPLYTFILFAVWSGILVLIYFVLNFRSGLRREYLRDGGPERSEYTEATGRTGWTGYTGRTGYSGYTGRTRMTETEYLESEVSAPQESSKKKWIGPLALGAAWWASRNKKNKADDKSRASMSEFSRGPETHTSRRGSTSYTGYDDETEKFTEVGAKKSGGGLTKILAAFGAGKLLSGMSRKEDKRDEYSAVSTETPRRHPSSRRGGARSEMTSDYTEDTRQHPTSTLLSPSGHPATTVTGARSVGSSRRPGPRRPSHSQRGGRRRSFEDSEYSSYVSPSRRFPNEAQSSGTSKGFLAGIGLGFISKKLADRRAKKEEQRRLQDEEDMQSGVTGSRYTADRRPSPSRKPTRQSTVRRPTRASSPATASDFTVSAVDDRPPRRQSTARRPARAPSPAGFSDITESSVHPAPAAVPPPTAPAARGRPRSSSQSHHDTVVMPHMPDSPPGIRHSDRNDSFVSGTTPQPLQPPQYPTSSRRRSEGTERYSSPVSVKLKVHDDRDRNVTLRRLTEEEARAARGRSRADSDSSIDSPSGRYRRDTSASQATQRRAESAAEELAEAEDDVVSQLPPPHQTYSRAGPGGAGGRRGPGKDSGYYSGPIGAGVTQSSLAAAETELSHGTWSEMSRTELSPGRGDNKIGALSAGEGSVSAADNRRRRRLERRGEGARKASVADMYD